MALDIIGTGVAVRLVSDEELRAIERARVTGEFALEPERSHVFSDGPPANDDEVYVVSQAFVEFADGDGVQRWESFEHHGDTLPTGRDATLELLRLVEDAAHDLIEDLLSDMRIAGLGVSRWELVSAPRRYELAPDLQARLAPLRRG